MGFRKVSAYVSIGIMASTGWAENRLLVLSVKGLGSRGLGGFREKKGCESQNEPNHSVRKKHRSSILPLHLA